MSERIRPFANGTEWEDWQFHNCDKCALAYDEETGRFLCELEQALNEASWGDGTLSPAIAHRLGCDTTRFGNPKPRCPEFTKVVRGDGELPPKAVGIDQQMRALGVQPLPGFEG